MSIFEEIEDDGDEILSELGREINFRDKKFLALIDNNPIEEIMGDGGFILKSGYRVRFLVRKDSKLSKEPPKQGEHMEVYGKRYTITRVTYRPPSPWVDAFVILSNQ